MPVIFMKLGGGDVGLGLHEFRQEDSVIGYVHE
jgi:hypothetical protein